MNQRRSASSATVVSDEPLLLPFLCLPASRAQRITAAGVGCCSERMDIMKNRIFLVTT